MGLSFFKKWSHIIYNSTNLKIIGNNYENIKGIRYMVIDVQITYTPTDCSKCGCVNEDYSIVKNWNKTVKILINRAGNNPVILRIKKQRFYCKHCESTFIGETTLTEKGCFISKDVKKSIVKELFPNDKIIIDKFNIVQLFNGSLNKYRILIMKRLHKKSHGYKISKTYWKLPLAKHWELDRVHFF